MPIDVLDLAFPVFIILTIALVGEGLGRKNPWVLTGIITLYAVAAVFTVRTVNEQNRYEATTREAVEARYDITLPGDVDDWDAPFRTHIKGYETVCELTDDGADARLACGSLDEPDVVD